MATADIRVKIDFLQHHKIRLLEKIAGETAALNLLQLWLYAGSNKTDGFLDMSLEDIELASQWYKEPSVFANALLRCKLLDAVQGGYAIHDWLDHNPYMAGEKARGDEGRLNRLKAVNIKAWQEFTDNGRTGITKEEYREITLRGTEGGLKGGLRGLKAPLTPYPSPYPSPLQYPKEKQPCSKEQSFELWWSEVVLIYWPKARRTGKGSAKKAWIKAKNIPCMEQLIEQAKALSKSDQWCKEGGQYCPLPATWLNSGRFDDPVPEAVPEKVTVEWGEIWDGQEYDVIFNQGSREDMVDSNYGRMSKGEFIGLRKHIYEQGLRTRKRKEAMSEKAVAND